MIAPARVAAYDILTAVSSGRADLPAAIAAARATLSDDRDRALATEIATGVQRSRAALDHLIVEFARRPIAKLDPQVIEILRLSLYQLLHLTRVPAPAVVDDAVDLSRRVGKTSAGGFINAVLRAATRRRRDLPLPPRPDDPANREAVLAYLSVTLSHPRWLAARWLDRYGFEATEAWMLFNNQPAPLTLRPTGPTLTRDGLSTDLAASGVRTRPARFAPDALVVEDGRPGTGPFLIQDEASQLVTLLAGPMPGPRVLDACASPGGKATAIAGAMVRAHVDRSPLLVACDVRPRRMELLRRTVAAAGASGIVLVQADLRQALPFLKPFDLVFVDAPCSGLGTLRRDPDLRWRRQEQDLSALAAAEGGMLRNAAALVAPGGRLVYATCSSEPEENERVVERFLESDDRFRLMDARLAHPAMPPPVVDAGGYLRTLPHAHGLEAFFGAVFVRAAA